MSFISLNKQGKMLRYALKYRLVFYEAKNSYLWRQMWTISWNQAKWVVNSCNGDMYGSEKLSRNTGRKQINQFSWSKGFHTFLATHHDIDKNVLKVKKLFTVLRVEFRCPSVINTKLAYHDKLCESFVLSRQQIHMV